MRWSLSALLAVGMACVLIGCSSEQREAASSARVAASVETTPHQTPAQTARYAVSEAAEAEFAADEACSDYGYEAYGVKAEAASGPAPAAAASEPAPLAERRPAAALSLREASEPPRRELGREPYRRNRGIQSGTLTAGSFDDNERFDDYQDFLSKAMQQDAAERLPRLAVGRRVLVHVTGAGGKPVGDARVVVRPAPQDRHSRTDRPATPALLDLTTGSDGRVLFLTGMDTGGGVEQFHVTVHPPDGLPPTEQVLHVDQAPWQITLPEVRPQLPKRLDLALVIDTTGSMSDELEYLKVEIDSIARAVYQQFPNVDQRYALVVYRDDGDQYVTRTFDFTGSLAEFRSVLAEQSASGGGDYPEAVHLALDSAAKLDWRDRQTARVLFHVADAPPHDRFADRAMKGISALRGRGVRIFPVASSGVALKAEFVMRAGAFLTLGQYLFLTDHSGIGNPHAKPHVPDYQVERLDRLMTRMIASELSGRRLGADMVIAVEQGDGSVPQPDQGPALPGQQQTPVLSTIQVEPFRFPKIPRWAILIAAILGACIVDTVLARSRS